MRSLANFRLSECQPLPRLGSSPARLSAGFHQTATRGPLTQAEGSRGAPMGNRPTSIGP